MIPKDMDEAIDSLYGVLSFLKERKFGLDAEINAIESARSSIMRKEDLKKCPKCRSKNVDLVYPTDDEMRIYGAPAGGLCLDCGHEWQIEEPEDESALERDWEPCQREDEEQYPPDEQYPDDDCPPDSEPCSICDKRCEGGFPCHQYDGCTP